METKASWVLLSVFIALFFSACQEPGPSASPTPPAPFLNKGQKYLKKAEEAAAKGDYQDAANQALISLDWFKRLYEKDPKDIAAARRVGADAYVELKKYEEALALYQKLAESDPKNTEYADLVSAMETKLTASTHEERLGDARSLLEEAESDIASGRLAGAAYKVEKILPRLKEIGDPALLKRVKVVRMKLAEQQEEQRVARIAPAKKFLAASTPVMTDSGEKVVGNEKLLRDEFGAKYIADAKAGKYELRNLKSEVSKIQKRIRSKYPHLVEYKYKYYTTQKSKK